MTTATPTRTRRKPELPLFSLPTDHDVIGRFTPRHLARPARPVFSDGR